MAGWGLACIYWIKFIQIYMRPGGGRWMGTPGFESTTFSQGHRLWWILQDVWRLYPSSEVGQIRWVGWQTVGLLVFESWKMSFLSHYKIISWKTNYEEEEEWYLNEELPSYALVKPWTYFFNLFCAMFSFIVVIFFQCCTILFNVWFHCL